MPPVSLRQLPRSAHPEPAPESPSLAARLAAQPDDDVEPCAPEPLRRLAEEWLERYPEDAITEIDVVSLTRLLERVVRECAREACSCGNPANEGPEHACQSVLFVLHGWGLDPESQEGDK